MTRTIGGNKSFLDDRKQDGKQKWRKTYNIYKLLDVKKKQRIKMENNNQPTHGPSRFTAGLFVS